MPAFTIPKIKTPIFLKKKELKNCQTYFSSIDAHCLQLHTINSFLTFHAHESDNWSPTNSTMSTNEQDSGEVSSSQSPVTVDEPEPPAVLSPVYNANPEPKRRRTVGATVTTASVSMPPASPATPAPVSYTHLTLPTNREV